MESRVGPHLACSSKRAAARGVMGVVGTGDWAVPRPTVKPHASMVSPQKILFIETPSRIRSQFENPCDAEEYRRLTDLILRIVSGTAPAGTFLKTVDTAGTGP